MKHAALLQKAQHLEHLYVLSYFLYRVANDMKNKCILDVQNCGMETAVVPHHQDRRIMYNNSIGVSSQILMVQAGQHLDL